jgi:hypothetical protein
MFLIAEIEAVNELYNSEKEKKEIEKQKELDKQGPSFADKVFEANRNKIEKYPKPELSFEADEELEKLIGAIRNLLNNYWPALTNIYNNDRSTTTKSMLSELHYQLLIKYDYKNDPPITRSYADLFKRVPVNQKKLEAEYYYILKETAFLLNNIYDILKSIIKEKRIPDIDLKLIISDHNQKEWYNANFKHLTHKECVEKVFSYLSDVIKDFRIKDIRRQ